jgi:hypothetical protein
MTNENIHTPYSNVNREPREYAQALPEGPSEGTAGSTKIH